MDYIERAAKYICYFLYAGAGYLFLKYGFPAVVPFLIAFLAASFAERTARRLSAVTKINKRIYIALILIIIIIALITCTASIFGRLIYEAREFANEYITEPNKLNRIINNASRISEIITAKLDLPPEIRESVHKTVDNAISRISDLIISKIGEILEGTVAFIISGIPSWILFITVTVISTFYFAGLKYTKDPILKRISSTNKRRLTKIKNGIITSVGKYLKAYLILISVTTVILFCGFSLIGIKYAFLIAILTAIIDMLPIIGLSTVMLPWGIIEISRGNAGVGFALLAIFAVAVIVREALEPKIIGKCIGANPLITLFAMYTGLKLFGIKGVIVLPIIVSGFVSYLSEKEHSAAIEKRPIAKRY